MGEEWTGVYLYWLGEARTGKGKTKSPRRKRGKTISRGNWLVNPENY